MDTPNESIRDTAFWQTRATTYELLAFSFRYPDADLVQVLTSGEWTEAVCEVVQVCTLDLPVGWQDELSCYEQANPEQLIHTLRTEATRLFVGTPSPVVSPFEGVQRAQTDGVQALLFVNPHSMEVERFIKDCGLGRPEHTNEPLDHVATELEFLQWLCMLEADISQAPVGIESPEEGWSGIHDRFLEEHARVWMPSFAEQVSKETREVFYGVAAGLLGAVIVR